MIKAVIFDSGGVLNELIGIDSFKDELNLSDEQIDHIWNDQIKRMQVGKLSESDFWQELTDKYGTRHVKPSEHLLSRDLAKQYKQKTDVLQIAAQLKKAGLKIAVLSNTIEPHAAINKARGTYDIFPVKILSNEVGYRKPDPAIYKLALKKLDVDAQEAVFIDDTPEFVAAAQNVGLHGIVFKNAQRLNKELDNLLLGENLE